VTKCCLIPTRSWTRVSWCAPSSEYSSHLFTILNKTYYTYYTYYTAHISKIHKTQFYRAQHCYYIYFHCSWVLTVQLLKLVLNLVYKMLSFNISYQDLIKCLYFDDTTEGEDRGWKEAQRQSEDRGLIYRWFYYVYGKTSCDFPCTSLVPTSVTILICCTYFVLKFQLFQ
jgi:hypothetical protein